MQNKNTGQLSPISSSKASLFFLVLFSLSACSSSNDTSSENTGTIDTTETTPSNTGNTTTAVSLSTALDNFKTVTTDAGLTAQ